MQESFDEEREILKWIAIVTMTIDHTGAALYPEHMALRFIGRLSFPLFGYLLVLGVESTRSLKNYLIRLLLFAFISQVPFYLAVGKEPLSPLNILVTLSLGVLTIHSLRTTNPLLILIPLFASVVLNFDYGIYGLIAISCIYLLTIETKLGVISLVLLNFAFLLLGSPYQILSLLALPFILAHKRGFQFKVRNVDRKTVYPLWRKYLFYVYYPLHLTVLYLIKAYYWFY